MTDTVATLPEHVFDDIVAAMLKRFGDGWIQDKKANRAFKRGAVSLLSDADGLHLIGEPEIDDNSINFNVWIDFPVDDVLIADDVAFDMFSRLAQEIFVSTRIIEARGVRYRFITGSARGGHLGSINLTGPYAVEFANLHRMKSNRGLHFNA